MQVNGGQNIVQANNGGGIAGAIMGGIASARAQRTKFQLQVELMNRSHNLALQRDEARHNMKNRENLFKIVGKNMAEGMGTESNFKANQQSYIDTHTAGIDKEKDPEAFENARQRGIAQHQEHVSVAGMRNGVINEVSKEYQTAKYRNENPTESTDADTTAGKKGKKGKASEESSAEESAGKEEASGGRIPPTQLPNVGNGISRNDWNTFHDNASDTSEKYPGTGVTHRDSAIRSIFAQTGRGTVSVNGGGIKQSAAAPAAKANWNKAFNNMSINVDLAKNEGADKPAVSNFPPTTSNVPGAKNNTPDPFGAINSSSVSASVNRGKSVLGQTQGEGSSPERGDIAEAYTGGKITKEEANDYAGENRFGEGSGNYNMSDEQVHRNAGLNTHEGSTRINEFSSGQEKE
jgi:hypothetical protein